MITLLHFCQPGINMGKVSLKYKRPSGFEQPEGLLYFFLLPGYLYITQLKDSLSGHPVSGVFSNGNRTIKILNLNDRAATVNVKVG